VGKSDEAGEENNCLFVYCVAVLSGFVFNSASGLRDRLQRRKSSGGAIKRQEFQLAESPETKDVT
jgi:hypothetical protein